MIPIMQEKICDKYKWMNEEEVLDCIAISQSLPGVIAINMATYVGYAKRLERCAAYNLRSYIAIVYNHYFGGIFIKDNRRKPICQGSAGRDKSCCHGSYSFCGMEDGKADS